MSLGDAFAIFGTMLLGLGMVDLVLLSFGFSNISHTFIETFFGEDSLFFATWQDPVEKANKLWHEHKHIADIRQHTKTDEERVTWDSEIERFFEGGEANNIQASPRKQGSNAG